MYKLLITGILWLCCIANTCLGQWNYYGALSYARQNNRKTFVLFHAKWCQPCRMLQRDVITPLMPQLSKKYVVYSMDVDNEHDVYLKWANAGFVRGVPFYCILDEKLNVLGYSSGYKNLDEFIQWHNLIISSNK